MKMRLKHRVSKQLRFKTVFPVEIVVSVVLYLCIVFCDCAILHRSQSSPKVEIREDLRKRHSYQCGAGAEAKNCEEVQGGKIPLILTPDGYLKFHDGVYLSPEHFCIARGGKYAKLCSSHIAPVPWRKCCPAHQLLNPKFQKTCTDAPPFSYFRPEVNGALQNFFVASQGSPPFSCPKGYKLKKFGQNKCAERSMTRFELAPNGTISYEVSTGVFLRKNKWRSAEPSSDSLYCLDGVIETGSCNRAENSNRDSLQPSGSIKINNLAYTHGTGDDGGSGGEGSLSLDCETFPKPTPVLYICLVNTLDQGDIQEDDLTAKTTFLSILWLFTCPLLFGASIVNYCLIQRNVHGWILTCYLLSMCVLNVLSTMVILEVSKGSASDNASDPNDDNNSERGACSPLDFLIKFTYMSTLCWITSINFGLWKTFSYTLPQPAGTRRFLCSVLFSLGFPFLSICVCYYVGYSGTDPQCKQEYCLLFSYDTIPFYSLPIAILVLGNFAIFLKTSYTITVLRREAEDVLKRQAQDHLESFTLFAKLFLLTGSIWLLRLVLFALQVQGLYLTWYGVVLESIFSIPEVVFPMIVLHHQEFIKWSWNVAPGLSRFISRLDPLFQVAVPNDGKKATR